MYISLNMVFRMVIGLLERFMGLMGSAFGSIFERIWGILLDICILKWGMVPRPGFGPISGVGRAASRRDFLNYFALQGIRRLWFGIIFAIKMVVCFGILISLAMLKIGSSKLYFPSWSCCIRAQLKVMGRIECVGGGIQKMVSR